MRSVSLSLSLTAALATLLASAPRADEVRLADGRVLVGATVVIGKYLRVETPDGPVKVARVDVVAVRSEADLRAEFERLASRTQQGVFGQVQLARVARDWGLYPEMWERLGDALQRDARNARLRNLLAELEPQVLPRKWRKRSTEIRVRELLYRIRPGVEPARVAAVEELLMREPDAEAILRKRARSATKAPQRLAAVRALTARGGEKENGFLYRTTILDGSAKVRAGAAQTVRQRDRNGQAVRYLAPGLMHGVPAIRIRTAEAFGHMRAAEAVDLLVDLGPMAGKPRRAAADHGGVRGHIAILDQQSYIRDFDVEVAQAAFIADPKIDVLQSGVVLDTTVQAVVVHRTEIVRAYRDALRRISGSDPGSDPRKWAAWRAQRRATATESRTQLRAEPR